MTQQTPAALPVLVSGGGIGGLASALATARAGWQVALLEQSPVFGEVGAGIQLGPNVVKVLQGLGLEQALRQRFPVWQPRTLDQLFDAIAAEFAQRPCLITDQRSWSYAELRARWAMS